MKNHKIFEKEFVDKMKFFLLGTHVCYLLFFLVIHVWFMVFFNIFSVLFYLSGVFWIHKNQILYFYSFCFEVMLHMLCATLCVGWLAGFQLFFFLMIQIAYFANYSSATTYGQKLIRTRPIEIAGVILFLITSLSGFFAKPVYRIADKRLLWVMLFVNTLYFFSSYVYYMKSYEKYIFSTQIKMNQMALKDPLTDLHNRFSMLRLLKQTTNLKSIAILDIDDFKKINDTYGHLAGDEMLKMLSNLLKNTKAIASRWGGEEFLLFMQGEQSYEALKQEMCDLILHLNRSNYTFEDQVIKLTVTIGLAQQVDNEALEGVIKRADMNLYEGKRNGKNQLCESLSAFHM